MTRKHNHNSHSSKSPSLEFVSTGGCYRSKFAIGNKTIRHTSFTKFALANFKCSVIYNVRGCKCSAPTFRRKIAKVVGPVSASAAECAPRDRATPARRIPFQAECVLRSVHARARASRASDTTAACHSHSAFSSSLVSTFSNSLSREQVTP